MELTDIPQEFSAIKSLEEVVDRFTYLATRTEKVSEVNKLLSVAEKAARLMISMEQRDSDRNALIELACSWIRNGIRQAELYKLYKAYCLEHGTLHWSNQAFYNAVRSQGFKTVRKRDTYWLVPNKPQHLIELEPIKAEESKPK